MRVRDGWLLTRRAGVPIVRAMDAYLQQALDAIERTTAPLDEAAIAAPVPGRWSTAQVLEHLTLAFRANVEAIEKALASGEVRGRPPRLAQRLGRILVIDIGYFPRVQAPERTRPTGSIPAARSVGAICEALVALDAALTRASARFGDRALVANHPYFQGLTVPQWRKFHWRHTVHHLRGITGGQEIRRSQQEVRR